MSSSISVAVTTSSLHANSDVVSGSLAYSAASIASR
eukprot:CAMPEP_0174858552 /NCGR_PEP_ID=MMETSP1114-20130205/43061_1 /TAXON_ID=312471 /ORGANISM="Neobodo designis, Strain CCAP 1951/1" /LENGTH=35 /DNA_ID= /DNA_START= /DNA_END= /DNA_ORIENTATION=